MKTRTRVFAWFAIVISVIFLFAVIGIASLVSESFLDEVPVVVPAAACLGVAPVLAWIALLNERKWAWWLLVVFYAGCVLLGLSHAGNDPWGWWSWNVVVLALFLGFLGLPLPILLTDRPSGWTSDAGEAPGNSGPEIAPVLERKQETRLGPLTLIEWLVVLAILGILAAVIAPAVQRARLAARAAPAASSYETPREADNYLAPR
jgi:hypothetical protein